MISVQQLGPVNKSGAHSVNMPFHSLGFGINSSRTWSWVELGDGCDAGPVTPIRKRHFMRMRFYKMASLVSSPK